MPRPRIGRFGPFQGLGWGIGVAGRSCTGSCSRLLALCFGSRSAWPGDGGGGRKPSRLMVGDAVSGFRLRRCSPGLLLVTRGDRGRGAYFCRFGEVHFCLCEGGIVAVRPFRFLRVAVGAALVALVIQLGMSARTEIAMKIDMVPFDPRAS